MAKSRFTDRVRNIEKMCRLYVYSPVFDGDIRQAVISTQEIWVEITETKIRYHRKNATELFEFDCKYPLVKLPIIKDEELEDLFFDNVVLKFLESFDEKLEYYIG